VTRTSLLTIPAIAFGLLLGGSALAPQEASAEVRVRIGGRAHVRINGGGYRPHRVRVIRPWRHRHVHRPVIHVGGHIWLGGGYYYERPFAQPPPAPAPAPACNCGPEYYGPIAPAPVYGAAVVVAEEPRLPRWGLGVFMGGVSVDGEHEGEDVGLIGQIRLTKGLLLEGEIAENTLEDGGRIDRRMLLGLNYEFGAHRKLAPYVTGGIGTTQVEVEGGWEDNQAVAEIGAGLRYRLSPRISLFGDLRFGSRESIEDESDPRPLPEPGSTGRALLPEGDEDYSRVRLGGMITF
jgi:hypothetical protein